MFPPSDPQGGGDFSLPAIFRSHVLLLLFFSCGLILVIADLLPNPKGKAGMNPPYSKLGADGYCTSVRPLGFVGW